MAEPGRRDTSRISRSPVPNQAYHSLHMADLGALCAQRIRLAQEEQGRLDAVISNLLRQHREQNFIHSHENIPQSVPSVSPFLLPYSSSPRFPISVQNLLGRDLLNRHFAGHSSLLLPPPPAHLTNRAFTSAFLRVQNVGDRFEQWPFLASDPNRIGAFPGVISRGAATDRGSDIAAVALARSDEARARSDEARARSPPVIAQEKKTREDSPRGKREAKKSPRPSSSGSLQAKHPKRTRRPSPQPQIPLRDRRKYDSESFAVKLFRMCTDQGKVGNNGIVEFLVGGGGFWLHDPERMVSELMPQYFRGRTYASFRRQLISYGFRKSMDVDDVSTYGAFLNPLFSQGKLELCQQILRDNRYDRAVKAPESLHQEESGRSNVSTSASSTKF